MEVSYMALGIGLAVFSLIGLILAIVFFFKGKVWGPSYAMSISLGATGTTQAGPGLS